MPSESLRWPCVSEETSLSLLGSLSRKERERERKKKRERENEEIKVKGKYKKKEKEKEKEGESTRKAEKKRVEKGEKRGREKEKGKEKKHTLTDAHTLSLTQDIEAKAKTPTHTDTHTHTDIQTDTHAFIQTLTLEIHFLATQRLISSAEFLLDDTRDHDNETHPGSSSSVVFGFLWGQNVVRKRLIQQWYPNKDTPVPLRREIENSLRTYHPNISSLLGWYLAPFERGYFLNLIYPEVMTSLWSFGEDVQTLMDRLPVSLAIRYAMSIARALQYLHDRGLAHRDLSPSNILVCDNFDDVILIDMGSSRHFADKEVTASQFPSNLYYRAPESHHGLSVDVFSFGMIFYYLLTGRHPHSHLSQDAAYQRYLIREFPPLDAVPGEFRDLIGQCWRETHDRPSIAIVISMLQNITSTSREWTLEVRRRNASSIVSLLPNVYEKVCDTDRKGQMRSVLGVAVLESVMRDYTAGHKISERFRNFSRSLTWKRWMSYSSEELRRYLGESLDEMFPILEVRERDPKRDWSVDEKAHAWMGLLKVLLCIYMCVCACVCVCVCCVLCVCVCMCRCVCAVTFGCRS